MKTVSLHVCPELIFTGMLVARLNACAW